MKHTISQASRRRFLRQTGKYAALAAAVGTASVNPRRLLAQAPELRIREVKAYPIYINQRSDRLLDAPSFEGDDDPSRWRWGGPFEQLPSAISAVIKTDQGITCFGMGAGGRAAVEIIDGHPSRLLLTGNPLKREHSCAQVDTSGDV